jgi:hypothetical protein
VGNKSDYGYLSVLKLFKILKIISILRVLHWGFIKQENQKTRKTINVSVISGFQGFLFKWGGEGTFIITGKTMNIRVYCSSKWTSRAVLPLFRFFVFSWLINRGVGGGVR